MSLDDEKRYDVEKLIEELRSKPDDDILAKAESTEPPVLADNPPKKSPAKFELHLNLDDEYGDVPDKDEVRIYEVPASTSVPDYVETNSIGTGDAVDKKTAHPFELHLDLDDEYGDVSLPEVTKTPAEFVPISEEPVAEDEQRPTGKASLRKKLSRQNWGCLWTTLYGSAVLLLSVLLSYTIIVGFLDFSGIGKDGVLIDITVPENVSNAELAKILEDSDLIDEGWIFRIYAKLVKGEGNWQAGTYTLSPNMGYQTLSSRLRTAASREVVRVTIPEGFTVRQIAQRLEEKGVCTESEFIAALDKDYSADYDFVADLQSVSESDIQERVYLLEGYLFPDTYDFYKGCSGETVVRRMLNNFDNRMSTQFRAAAKEQGLKIDEVVILASIVQGEANNPDDMAGVARVFLNRLSNSSVFPCLESDATGEYLVKLNNNADAAKGDSGYNTYNRKGLPVGAINCPGEDAIRAVLWPADDKDLTCTCSKKGVKHSGTESSGTKMYFFATYYDTATEKYVTGYHTTNEAHSRFCDAYDIHD